MASQARTRRRPTTGNIAFLASLLASGLLVFYFFTMERRNPVPTINAAAGLLSGIPAIDKAAPKKTETATFSLG